MLFKYIELVRRNKKPLVGPLVGLVSSSAVCYLLIRLWFADMVAETFDWPVANATGYLLSLLILLQVTRALAILAGGDPGANFVEGLFKDQDEADPKS